jgi:hypothetical protein
MRLIDCYVFKSPERIDWQATEEKIRKEVIKADKKASPSEKAAWAADLTAKARLLAKRRGVEYLYNVIELEKVRKKINGDKENSN